MTHLTVVDIDCVKVFYNNFTHSQCKCKDGEGNVKVMSLE